MGLDQLYSVVPTPSTATKLPSVFNTYNFPFRFGFIPKRSTKDPKRLLIPFPVSTPLTWTLSLPVSATTSRPRPSRICQWQCNQCHYSLPRNGITITTINTINTIANTIMTSMTMRYQSSRGGQLTGLSAFSADASGDGEIGRHHKDDRLPGMVLRSKT